MQRECSTRLRVTHCLSDAIPLLRSPEYATPLLPLDCSVWRQGLDLQRQVGDVDGQMPIAGPSKIFALESTGKFDAFER